jgi:hypothetical protein
MPRPNKTSPAPKTVVITESTLKALIRCRNELYEIYSQFGGTSNVHISKGLGDENADWNFINNWEIDNIDDDDDDPSPRKVKAEKELIKPLDHKDIAIKIYNRSNEISALQFLHIAEISERIHGMFEDDLEQTAILSSQSEYISLNALASVLSKTFVISLGTQNDYSWLKQATFNDVYEVLVAIRDLINADEDD